MPSRRTSPPPSAAVPSAPCAADARWRRGAQAERLAALHLESRGVRIIARNFRWRGGELDLVGVAGGLLLFVEVRQRTRADFGGGLASVNSRKRRRLRRAAEYFRLRRPEWRAHRARFDVLAVEGADTGAERLVWVQDAFN